MKRFANIALALAVFAITAVVADPQVGVAAGASAPRSELIDPLCQVALDPAGRVVSVTAVMRPLQGTQKLAVEFQLFERASGTAAWTLISDPVVDAHLGVWITPPDATLGQRPGDVWNVPFEVANLAAPAAYRFSVEFRWTGLHGRVLGLLTRVSGACKQPELRPDLTVSSVAVSQDPAHPRRDQFAAVIGDDGLTGAGPFTLQLTYTHDQLAVTDSVTVAHIGPHVSRTLQLTGQLCDAGTDVTVTADPDDQIDVYSRSQASLTVICPAPTISVSPGPPPPITSTTNGSPPQTT